MLQLTQTKQQPQACKQDFQLVIFELGYGGHYASYIRYLAQYWCKQELSGHLHIVVSLSFAEHHPDVIAIASGCKLQNLSFTTITAQEEAKLIPRKNSVYRALRSFQEWKLLHKYTTLLKATHCLLLYFDSFQAAIASGAKLTCSFSGIYFRPTFHYDAFTGYVPSWKNRLRQWREKFVILPRVMHHPKLQNLFCLDPFVVDRMDKFASSAKAIHLPDPVQLGEIPNPQVLEKFRESLNIERDRKTFLLFGALYDSRKGINEVLEAISNLPPHLCKQLCLLLVGQIFLSDESPLQKRIEELSRSLPVQIIIRDEFIREQDIQLYFQSTDVVLAPYQRHVGMSGIAVLAAAAQKPLLISDFGLMGEIARCWQLGLTVDSTNPDGITQGLTRFLMEDFDNLCDRDRMKAFAEQNSSDRFANIIFQHLSSVKI